MNDTSSDATTPTKWGIIISTTSYQLVKNANGTQSTPFNLPNELSSTHNFSGQIRATAALTLWFDEWGSPWNNNTPSTKLAAAATITLTPGPQSFTVAPDRGWHNPRQKQCSFNRCHSSRLHKLLPYE